MSQAQKKKIWTLEEYFELEKNSDEKHEFYKGEIFAMSGGSYNHGLIASNFLRLLSNSLIDKPCDVIGSDLRVQVAKSGLCTYPDLSVICGEPEFAEGRNDIITNPMLIVEVLSPSTTNYDRGGKFQLYRTLNSLEHYILISQDRVLIEYFYKNEKEHWELEEFQEIEQSFKIYGLELEIQLSEIYNKVKFSEKQ